MLMGYTSVLRPDPLLLWLRISTSGLLCFGHGVGKIALLTGDPNRFPDPLGIGPVASVMSSLLVECVGSFLVALGFMTRLSCVAVLSTMATIAIIVHRHDGWPETEPSVLFFLLFSVVLGFGPGRYSMDAWIASKRRPLS